MLGGIGGRKRRGWQMVRWLDGITDSMDVSLSELREFVMDRAAWHVVIHGVAKSHTQLCDWTELNWSHFSCVQLFVTLWTLAHQATLPMDSPGKNTGVGFHALLQRIFPTQRSNLCLLCLLHWQEDSLPLSHWGSPITPWANFNSEPHVEEPSRKWSSNLARLTYNKLPWYLTEQRDCIGE